MQAGLFYDPHNIFLFRPFDRGIRKFAIEVWNYLAFWRAKSENENAFAPQPAMAPGHPQSVIA